MESEIKGNIKENIKIGSLNILELQKSYVETTVCDKVILITGGTGSFGQKFISVLYQNFKPKAVVVFSRDEFKQHQMRTVQGFNEKKYSTLYYAIGDIRNRQRLYDVLREYKVDIVIHTAAIKHIDICEKNPTECIDTNIMGTINLVGACKDASVKRVLALSTDKCVDPINIYGASKLCLERLVITANNFREINNIQTHSHIQPKDRDPIFSVVRYGNVLGSRGSVVHVFAEQLKQGSLKITDENMTRFTIMKEQAVNFAMNCLGMMIGGEVFVPELPTYNLKQLINIMKPHKDFPVINIGIRPGEKIHECMISKHESHLAIHSDGFYVVKHHYYGNSVNYNMYTRNKTEASKTLEEQWSYMSDNDTNLIDSQRLRAMIAVVLNE